MSLTRFGGHPILETGEVANAGNKTTISAAAVNHLVDAQPPEFRPEVLIGDTAYGTGQVRADLAVRQMQVVVASTDGDDA
ncbi:MAG: hypothetical protein AB1445_05280 [Bacillota bacterium]